MEEKKIKIPSNLFEVVFEMISTMEQKLTKKKEIKKKH